MRESTNFIGKRNKGWKPAAKRWKKRDIQKLPTMRSGVFVLYLPVMPANAKL